ncbi:general secretion pathway protein GspB [Thermodesulfobacteriota bacterium]
MSSILKALKKLEAESPDKADMPSLTVVRRTAKSSRHRVKGDRVFYIGIIVLFLIVILAGSTWFIFDRISREISISPPAATDKERPSPNTTQKEGAGLQVARQPEPPLETEIKYATSTAVTEKKTVLPDSFRKEEIDAQAEKQPEKAVKEIAASAPVKSAPLGKPPPGAVETETQFEALSVRSNESVPLQAYEKNNAFSRSYSEGYEQSEPLDLFAAIPVKSEDDSGLKLQAIAWSEDPQHRMAVINSNIVREGGSVEGSAVTHIGEDMVVFKKEGEEWKQVFRLR